MATIAVLGIPFAPTIEKGEIFIVNTFIGAILLVIAHNAWAFQETTTYDELSGAIISQTNSEASRQAVSRLQFTLVDESHTTCRQPQSEKDRVWLIFFDQKKQTYSLVPREEKEIVTTDSQSGESCAPR